MSLDAGRLFFDISSLARWAGPSVGIARVERELALWARQHVPEVEFVLFDPAEQNFRSINEQWRDPVLQGEAIVNFSSLPEPVSQKRRFLDQVPAWLRPAMRWVLQFRRQLIFALERIRISTAKPRIGRAAEVVQRALMSARYRNLMMQPDGRRRALVRFDLAAGKLVEFRREDMLVCAGFAWAHTNVEAIKRLKKIAGFRFVILCYDIIPLMFPQFYQPHDAGSFRRHYHEAFPIADVVLFSARRVEADARAYCAARDIRIGETRVVPLGADAVVQHGEGDRSLPAGLERGKYALFVSTIEPRKGHRLLYGVWLRLLADGVPQQTDFKLVFVGRPGWLVEDLMQSLRTDARIAGSLVLLPQVEDRELGALYDGAAFCLYPSLYEGYGLPIIEAFFHGKAVLASTGGAIPEVVGEFSPCLDPADAEAWYRTMKQWILEPAARAGYEQAIRQRFRHPTWHEAAARFFAEVEAGTKVTRASENHRI
jgi:glycosyltransferase involved in cell wall biosynthesis